MIPTMRARIPKNDKLFMSVLFSHLILMVSRFLIVVSCPVFNFSLNFLHFRWTLEAIGNRRWTTFFHGLLLAFLVGNAPDLLP